LENPEREQRSPLETQWILGGIFVRKVTRKIEVNNQKLREDFFL